MSAAAAAIVAPTCVTIQRGGVGAVADTFIRSNALLRNFGGQPALRVSARDETLLRFDLASIPPGAAVSSATLKLYVNGDNGEGTIRVHRVLAAWAEGTVTFANFRQRFAPESSAVFRAESRTALKNIDLTRLVASWLGGQANYGVLLEPGPDHRGLCDRHEDEDRDPTVFVSSEAANASKRPALEVCYTLPVDSCASQPCQHGGLCVNGSGGYACQCDAGYTGSNCEVDINDCASNPCRNGGVCTDGLNAYSCACADGFTGTHCETNIDECASGPCQNGGVCTDAVAGYTCSCTPGYDGVNCEHLIDNCAALPCHNGGVCTNRAGGYACACASGFEGTNCDVNTDDCVGNLCVNGTCIDQINGYTCSCAPDWGGARCEVDLNRCAQAPCLNGGSCTNGVGTYVCSCAAGYAGTNCEVDLNDCAPNPCLHGGACVDGVASYTCACPSGYTGARCETATIFYSVNVSSSGSTGGGTFESAPAGISCAAGTACAAQFAQGSTVTLTATPDASSAFAGWSGCSSQTSGASGGTCTVSNLQANTSVFASFVRVHYALSVGVSGAGQGTVVSSPAGINCGYVTSTCGSTYVRNTMVTLTAVPRDAQHTVGAWTGCASTSGANCTVLMDQARSVNVRFDLL
ncbi:MAG: DNRLRE domain-containing protein [Polyangiales bacterium]